LAVRTLSVNLVSLVNVAVEGATVTLRLMAVDHTGSSTIVVSSDTATTDAAGDCSFTNVIPNVDGSQSRKYICTGHDGVSELFNVEFQMPDANSALHNLVSSVDAVSSRTPYLDANQLWTGDNTFGSSTTGVATVLFGTTTLNGTTTGVTQSPNDNSTNLATTAYTDAALATVDTLAEILVNGNSTGGTDIVVTALDSITTDTISETTAAAGVTIDGTLIKDGVVTADLTGNVTGNTSGTAATVTTAAQPSITSLGALTTLTVDDITVNANGISSAGASALTITATVGQSVNVESVTLDGGVVAGITSINIGGTTITGGVLDEDAMGSNSASALATQQSIKAYADATAAATVSASNLDNLADVTVTTIASGELLKWNGAAWVNNTLAEVGVQPLATVLTNTTASFLTADETKLDAIETGATADQTNEEIRTAVEAATDSNVFTDADHTKLNGIATGAEVNDSTTVLDADIGVTVQGYTSVLAATTASFTTSDETKLDAIETGATADQTNTEIRDAVEAATNSNTFTDADHTKLNGIESLADVTDATNVDAAGAAMDSDFSANGMMERTGAGTYTTIKNNETTTAPGTSDDNTAGYAIRSIWIDTTANLSYIATDVSTGTAVWKNIDAASGTGDLVAANNLSDVANALTATQNLSVEIGVDVQAYNAALTGTTATFLLADETKLDAIEAGATADQTDAEIRAAVEAATDSNVFTDADHTKLNGIEALADVTDATNVTAAGALMDSEVDADIKTLVLPANTTISAFGATLIDDATQGDAQTTLGVDAAGTDNSTNVTFAGTGSYLSLAGQQITVDPITESDISDLGAYITDIAGSPLGQLSDVTITTIASGELLKWNGSAWINNTLAEVGVQPLATVLTNTTASFLTADEAKLDGIEALADVTDATNVTAAGALMDSELTSIASVKALNQGVSTGDSPTFANVTATLTGNASGITGVTSTTAELNILDGVTSTAAELNILDGVTSTAAELNILDGVTSTAAELNILDGVTATAAEINLLDALDRGSILYGNASGVTTVLGQGSADQVLTSDGTDIAWQDAGGAYSAWLIKTTTFTCASGDQLIANHATTAFTITLPASPSVGDTVTFKNVGAALLTVGRNSENINSAAEDATMPTGNAAQLVYVDVTIGWTTI